MKSNLIFKVDNNILTLPELLKFPVIIATSYFIIIIFTYLVMENISLLLRIIPFWILLIIYILVNDFRENLHLEYRIEKNFFIIDYNFYNKIKKIPIKNILEIEKIKAYSSKIVFDLDSNHMWTDLNIKFKENNRIKGIRTKIRSKTNLLNISFDNNSQNFKFDLFVKYFIKKGIKISEKKEIIFIY